MPAFQHNRNHTEKKVLVELLSEIERSEGFTQRGLADHLGIALGLMNQYLKRCVAKGWVRATQISPKRISYFITPEGFHEKSVMVKDYLARSLTFFRDAKTQCEDVLLLCKTHHFNRIALYGIGDLADIAKLVAHGTGISVEHVSHVDDVTGYDAVLITDVVDPQGTYNQIIVKFDEARIFTLPLLHVSRGRGHD